MPGMCHAFLHVSVVLIHSISPLCLTLSLTHFRNEYQEAEEGDKDAQELYTP